MISSTLFPSEHALDGTKLPLIITPLKSGTKPATSSSNNGGANLSKLPTPNAKELARSPVPPNSPKRGKQPATVSGGKNGTNLAPGSSLAPASAKAPRNCLGAQLATWSEGSAPVYTYEVITRNGKPMIEAALKNRPWWGPCKTSWEQDDQCTFFFYPYNRTDDRAILRSRGKADPARLRLWNHVEWNKWLTSKKGLYFSLREYCEISLSEGKGSAEDAAPSGGVTKQQYALDELVPATYYVQGTGDSDEEMQRFTAHVERLKVSADDAAPIADTKNRNYWIVKPAAGSNQGDGIRVLGGDDVAAQVRTIIESGGEDGVQGGRGGHRGWRQFGWIVQKYIERPLLVHGRKFDLRCYVLLVLERPKEETKSRLGKKKEPREAMRLPHHSDGLTAFLYDEGYVRTSSAPYSLDPAALSNIAAHLTNDAVQKQFEGEYGKHEAANKLDFKQFQAYTSKHHGVRSDYVQKVLIPTLREYVKISVAAASQAAFKASQGGMQCSRISSTGQPEYEADGRGRGGGGVVAVTRDMDPNAGEPLPAHGYELLGYDFMLDDQLRLQLIEVNSNPCMDRPCKCLSDMLPRLNDDVFRTAIDPFFPVPKAAAGLFARAEREKQKNGFTKVFP